MDTRTLAALSGLDHPVPALPAATGSTVALARAPDISITARAAVRRFDEHLGIQRTVDACLLVSELVTNAYRHGDGQIRLTIALHGGVARFAVSDDGASTLPTTREPGEDGGWGLHIVARVADRWGASSDPTNVWFELRAIGSHARQPSDASAATPSHVPRVVAAIVPTPFVPARRSTAG